MGESGRLPFVMRIQTTKFSNTRTCQLEEFHGRLLCTTSSILLAWLAGISFSVFCYDILSVEGEGATLHRYIGEILLGLNVQLVSISEIIRDTWFKRIILEK